MTPAVKAKDLNLQDMDKIGDFITTFNYEKNLGAGTSNGREKTSEGNRLW